jgi:hypothetical protein
MAIIKKYKKYLRISALMWGICLAAFAMVYFSVIGPSYEQKRKLEKELDESRRDYELALKAGREDTKARLDEEIKSLQDKLDIFVLDYKSAADLTFDISRIAGESKISSFDIQKDDIKASSAFTDPNNLFEKHVKVSFTAGFREFAEFLNTLERHQPVLFINDFKLSRQNKDNGGYQVSLDIAALVRKAQVAESGDRNVEKIVGANY